MLKVLLCQIEIKWPCKKIEIKWVFGGSDLVLMVLASCLLGPNIGSNKEYGLASSHYYIDFFSKGFLTKTLSLKDG